MCDGVEKGFISILSFGLSLGTGYQPYPQHVGTRITPFGFDLGLDLYLLELLVRYLAADSAGSATICRRSHCLRGLDFHAEALGVLFARAQDGQLFLCDFAAYMTTTVD